MNTKFTFKFSTFLFAIGATALLSAQTQVQNSDFENWRTITNVNGVYNVPTHWNNINNAGGVLATAANNALTVDKSTDVRPGSTGQYSAQLQSPAAPFLVKLINGTLTTGQMEVNSFTPADGYTQTLTGNTDFSQPFTGKPTAITFWAKYSVTDGGDQARVSAIIHDDFDMTDPDTNPSGSLSPQHIVGAAVQNFQTSGEWQQITVPFDYSGPATTPKYILITFSSSAVPGTGEVGATLLLDDVQMVYPTTIASLTTSGLVENVNYNPADNKDGLKSVVNVDHIPTAASIDLAFNSSNTNGEALVKAWAILPPNTIAPNTPALSVQIEPYDLAGSIGGGATKDAVPTTSPYAISLNDLLTILGQVAQANLVPIPLTVPIHVVVSSNLNQQPTADITTNTNDIAFINFDVTLTNDASLATNETNFQGFKFGPNPVKDQLTLQGNSKIGQVELYNMNGQKVLSTKLNASKANVSTSNLTPGVYILKVTVDGSTKAFKVVKQ